MRLYFAIIKYIALIRFDSRFDSIRNKNLIRFEIRFEEKLPDSQVPSKNPQRTETR